MCVWVWLGYVTLFYSLTNMCMLVNKAAVYICVCVYVYKCECVSLCAFNDKIIRKLFVYIVAGAVLMWLPPLFPELSSPQHYPINVTANLLQELVSLSLSRHLSPAFSLFVCVCFCAIRYLNTVAHICKLSCTTAIVMATRRSGNYLTKSIALTLKRQKRKVWG